MENQSTFPIRESESAIGAGSAASTCSAAIRKARNVRKRNRRRRAFRDEAMAAERSVHNPAGSKLERRFAKLALGHRVTAAEAREHRETVHANNGWL